MMATNRVLPKRIILVRHGESQGNRDTTAYGTTLDNQIQLTTDGKKQAHEAGAKIRQIVSAGDGSEEQWKVYFYVSPYVRTRTTLSEISRSFYRREIAGAREECRIREQDFGNFQEKQKMKAMRETRKQFVRFFYRFHEGESAADVYDRVTSFLESMWRDIDMNRINRDGVSNFNIVIVSHGITARVFLMRWFKWTVEQFQRLNNPANCEIRVMQLRAGGKYSLAIQHTDEELQQWGLSKEMIGEQRCLATARRGDSDNGEGYRWRLDHLLGVHADEVESSEPDQRRDDHVFHS